VDKPNEAKITLDKLVELVERTVHAADALRNENAVLANDLKDCQAALQLALEKVEMQSARIDLLEREAQSLRKGAHWHHWFQNKYRNSTFFSCIEREYRTAHPEYDEGKGNVLVA